MKSKHQAWFIFLHGCSGEKAKVYFLCDILSDKVVSHMSSKIKVSLWGCCYQTYFHCLLWVVLNPGHGSVAACMYYLSIMVKLEGFFTMVCLTVVLSWLFVVWVFWGLHIWYLASTSSIRRYLFSPFFYTLGFPHWDRSSADCLQESVWKV